MLRISKRKNYLGSQPDQLHGSETWALAQGPALKRAPQLD